MRSHALILAAAFAALPVAGSLSFLVSVPPEVPT
jgi:hypothetical protein